MFIKSKKKNLLQISEAYLLLVHSDTCTLNTQLVAVRSSLILRMFNV